MTVLKILTYALVSTWSSVSSGWEHVKWKMHPWMIYILWCSVCLSRKIITSSWESPVTTITTHNHPVQLQVGFHVFFMVFHGFRLVFIFFMVFHGSRSVFMVPGRFSWFSWFQNIEHLLIVCKVSRRHSYNLECVWMTWKVSGCDLLSVQMIWKVSG